MFTELWTIPFRDLLGSQNFALFCAYEREDDLTISTSVGLIVFEFHGALLHKDYEDGYPLSVIAFMPRVRPLPNRAFPRKPSD